MMTRSLVIAVTTLLILTGCAASSGGGGTYTGGGTRALACKQGDEAISSANECLTDDAACYQLADNSWCTGERGLTCPTGSSEMPAGAVCPRGSRCFDASESLTCVVTY